MSSYREKRDQAIANEFHAGQMLCHWCRTLTPTGDLAEYGARCWSCYRAYCAQANTRYPGVMTRAQRQEATAKLRGGRIGHPDPKHWAKTLRGKEQAGATLTRMQRQAWREALGFAAVEAMEAA